MHRRYPFYLAVFILFFGCSGKKSCVTIAGSTSVQPFIEKLVEEFMVKNPSLVINVQGGGSTAGIQATINNTCNIGTSSRNLKRSEESLHNFVLCFDGIAIIVHRSNGIDNFTVDQISDIFAGRITNWKELGGANSMIIPVTREEGSGTRGAFEEMIMGEKAISDACLVQDSNGAVREIIATTPQGIGYISAGLIESRIKPIAVDGVYPTFENMHAGSYKFVRPFLLVTKEEPSGVVLKFLNYLNTSEAQEILRENGLITTGDAKE